MSYTLTVNINLESMDIESLKGLRAEIDMLLAKKQLVKDMPKLSSSLMQKMQESPRIAPWLWKKLECQGCKNIEDVYNLRPEKLIQTQKLTLTSIEHVLHVLKANGYDYEERWAITKDEIKDMLRQIKREKKDSRFSAA